MMDTESTNGLESLDPDIIQSTGNLLLESLGNESLNKVKEVVKSVDQFSKFERLLLYMELPSSQLISDPLRQPINPLGSRSEIQLTITWIRTHLEEDPQVSLPKHEVYDEYMEYCNDNALKALSTADFGKVMKQVYPQVRPRRLGTRGNSRYCYAGLRKKVKLEDPSTPEFMSDASSQCVQGNSSRIDDAATYLVLEWVEKLFKERIKNVKDLGLFLIEKMYVDNQSSAAHTLLSSIKMSNDTQFYPEKNNGMIHNEDLDGVKRKRVLAQSNVAPMEVVIEIDNKRERLDTMPDNSGLEFQKKVMLSETEEDMHKLGLTVSTSSTSQSTGLELPPFDNKSPKVKKDWEGSTEKQQVEDEMNSYFSTDPQSLMIESEVDANKNDKLSQLRQLLEKNLKSGGTPPNNSLVSAFRPAAAVDTDQTGNWTNYSNGSNGGSDSHGGGAESNASNNGTSLCQRRRVSFNPLVVQDTGAVSTTIGGVVVQPSPGTRKRHFSFQPISPRQNSLPQSPNASPFISPRSTPVPMLRSRHSSGSALPLHLLPQNVPKNPFGSSSSDTSRAATFGSTSECSTPFISPHGTPIPFNRSRHNSAQGRLCRSRHSSGVGPYRYSMTFSPMALNNLNNPYSPQPSTPITSQEESLYTILNHDNQRSRHSSAESEPPMRTVIMSPNGADKVFIDSGYQTSSRQRHASAGQATSSFISRESWNSLMEGAVDDNEKLLGDMKPSSDLDALKEDETGVFDAPFHDNGGHIFEDKEEEEMRKDNSNNTLQPDDLDITLSALKDCDNDFSKFVQETEGSK